MATKTKNKSLIYPALRVKWMDAKASGGWKSLTEDASKENTIEINSLGYLIHEDKKKITLAQQIGVHGQYSDTITIPKGWIVQRVKLGSEIVFEI